MSGLEELGPGIAPEQVPNLIGRGFGEVVNFYPGEPGHGCYDVAFFVALKGHPKARRGHLDLRKALECLVQHMSRCPQTRVGILLACNADWESLAAWQDNLSEIERRGVHLEFYLAQPGGIIRTR
jgi:hypothetical protein